MLYVPVVFAGEPDIAAPSTWVNDAVNVIL